MQDESQLKYRAYGSSLKNNSRKGGQFVTPEIVFDLQIPKIKKLREIIQSTLIARKLVFLREKIPRTRKSKGGTPVETIQPNFKRSNHNHHSMCKGSV